MQALDTLQIYERLKKAKASDALSKEVAEIFSELVEERLVTKKDLEKTEAKLQAEIKNTELRLHAEIEKSKADTIKWVAGLLLAQAGLIAAMVKLL
jgi:hypothetical protein